ncbi:hypothetical protein Ancab_040373 [Ancistrocladus abbreviatus]
MAEAVVISAAKWIATLLIEEAKFLCGVEGQVHSLKKELKCMQQYLLDMEENQLEEQRDGQRALFTETIRDLAFRAEDVIDTYIFRIASGYNNENAMKKFACCLSNTPHIHQVGDEIEAIEKEIEKAVQRLNRYGAVNIHARGEASSSSNQYRRQHSVMVQSYPHIEDEFVVGLDSDIQNLVGVVTGKQGNHDGAWVVSIVGLGGIGKTTLASKIYNHRDAINHFDCRVWVSISQQWNKRDVLLKILEKTGATRVQESNSMENWSEERWSDEDIILKIYQFLKERRYLVVLDDTWRKEAWDDISHALPHSKGSKIIITSRNQDVPPYVDENCFTHEPRFLTEEEGWKLFSKIALAGRNVDTVAAGNDPRFEEGDITKFEELGREMTEKCGGLPLAIVALAGVLRTKRGVDDWKRFNKKFTSNLMKAKGSSNYLISINEMLSLSYNDLPYYLKPCFLYLGLFPEDSDIQTGMLIRMLIAEGLVIEDDQLQGEEVLEQVAEQFLEELICRCMVQVVRRSYAGKVKACKLHDLVRDFCITKAKEQHFLQIFSCINSRTPSIPAHSRRVSIDGSSLPVQCSHLRTLVRFGQYDASIKNIYLLGSHDITLNLKSVHKDFNLLRVLNLWCINSSDGSLPEQIGNLIHLRYLGLVSTNIRQLPESVGNLRNLLTLEYRGSLGERVPNVLWKMENLRHLYLPDYPIYSQNTVLGKMDPLRHMHSRNTLKLDTLKKLQTLWGLYVEENMTRELKGLSPNLEKLKIGNISNEDQFREVFLSPSIRSGRLCKLCLGWYGFKLSGLVLFRNHCQHLQKLYLRGKINECSPLCFPPNLIVLRLTFSGLMLEDSIEAICQLHCLKALALTTLSYMGTKLVFKTNAFPRLEELCLIELMPLEEWVVEEGAMPRLKKLRIDDCGHLTRFPEALLSTTTLQELDIHDMPITFCEPLKAGETIANLKPGRDFVSIQRRF